MAKQRLRLPSPFKKYICNLRRKFVYSKCARHDDFTIMSLLNITLENIILVKWKLCWF